MGKKKIVVIGLFVLAFFLVPTSFAVFKSFASGNFALLSAEWSVSLEQNGVNSNLVVVPGVATTTYTLNVKSLSQVDVKYSIVLGNLPSGVEVSIDGVNFLQPSNGTVTFTNAGTILYSAANKVNSHSITFRGTSGASFVNNQTVTVDVIVEQMI